MLMPDGDEEGETRSHGSRSKDLKRYLILMGGLALMVLLGAFVYRQPSDGLHFSAMVSRLGQNGGVAVNAPTIAGENPARPVSQAAGFGPAPAGSGGPFSSVVTLLRNSVVSVTASSSGGQAMPDPLRSANPDGLPHFANPTTRSVENIGTGVIVRNDGFIVTNYHVVRGANSVFVTVQDDVGSTRYSAEIVKMDEALDLALLKIIPKAQLAAAVLGDSDAVLVADEVIAIGTPFGLDMTVSRGIISAKGKTMVIEGVSHSNLLQTDAAINQGNSGGPLVATNGTVIGINTAIYTPNGAFAGIGFSVPSNKARLFVLDEVGWLPTSSAEGATMGLVAFGSPGPGAYGFAQPPGGLGINVQGGRGRSMSGSGGSSHHTLLGAMMAPMSPQQGLPTGQPVGRGVLLSGVIPNSPAAAAGLLPGDILVRVDGRPVAAPRDVVAIMAEMSSGRSVRLGVLRNGDVRNMNLMVGPGAVSSQAFNWLGLQIETFPQSQASGHMAGTSIAGVLAGSRAASAGLLPRDLIVEVNNRPVPNPALLEPALRAAAPGQQILLQVDRNGQKLQIML